MSVASPPRSPRGIGSGFYVPPEPEVGSPQPGGNSGNWPCCFRAWPLRARRYLQASVSANSSDAQSAVRLKAMECVMQMDSFRRQSSVAQRKTKLILRRNLPLIGLLAFILLVSGYGCGGENQRPLGYEPTAAVLYPQCQRGSHGCGRGHADCDFQPRRRPKRTESGLSERQFEVKSFAIIVTRNRTGSRRKIAD